MERLEHFRCGGKELVHLAFFTLPQPKANELFGPVFGPVFMRVFGRLATATINSLQVKTRKANNKTVKGSRFPCAMGADFAGAVSGKVMAADVMRPPATGSSMPSTRCSCRNELGRSPLNP